MKKLTLAMSAFIAAHCAFADRVIGTGYTLSSDEDWTGLGPVRLSPGATLDLAGNSLKCDGFAEYVELDHVDTDGTQWINTHYNPSGTDKVELKFQMLDVATQQFILCSRKGTAATDGGFGLWMNGSGKLQFMRRNASGAGAYDTALALNTDYTTVQDYNNKWWSVNGVVTDFSETTNGKNSLTTYGPFALFCSHTGGASLTNTTSVANMAQCRFYYMKVWDKDGNLKCDIIPALGINENKVGLYDRARGVFLTPVTYGGAATTFAGVSAHCELPYVDTDGAQYVKTGYVPSLTNAVEMSLQMLEKTSKSQVLFCTRSSTGMPFEGSYTSAGKFNFVYSNSHTTTIDQTYDAGEDAVIGMSPDTSSSPFTVDCFAGATTNNLSSGYGASNKPSQGFWLFAQHKGGSLQANTYAKCRFYYFKVWDDRDKGTLKVDMVPVYHYSSGKVRLYDKVRSVYKDPEGGDFALPWSMTVTNSAVSIAELEVNTAADTTNILVTFAGDIKFTKSGEGAWTVSNGLDVTGVLKPVAGSINGVTMQSGSVLDLSAYTGAFDLSENNVSFADGATVGIVIGGRKLSSSERVVSWSVAPSNLDTLTFTRGDVDRRYRVVKKADGIYYSCEGFIISFQ